MSDTSVLASQKKDHTGWHAFWGIIGAAFGLGAIALVAIAGTYFYNNYVPASVHAQVQQQVDTLHTQVKDMQTHMPQTRPNGDFVINGVGPDGQPQRTEGVTFGMYDRLHGDLTSLEQTVKAGFASSAQQIAATNKAVEALSGQSQANSDQIRLIGDRVTKLETAQAAPAPVQQPAPQAVPQTQAPANPAPAVTSQAAPAAPAPQFAQGGDVNLVIPKWMKIQIDGEPNDHVKACVAPHHAEIDFKSPKCFDTGRKNQYGNPIMNCPNKCV